MCIGQLLFAWACAKPIMYFAFFYPHNNLLRPHVTVGETGDQRDVLTFSRSHQAGKRQRWDVNPGISNSKAKCS